MESLIAFLRFVHVLGAVFMAWPLYALVTVNERGRLGPPLGAAGDRADSYMENIIRGMAVRCYGFQFALLVTGILLVWLPAGGLAPLVTNWALGVKGLLLLVLMGLLSYIHFSLQPRLDALFAQPPGQAGLPQPVTSGITALRMRRKRIAATCLFLVLTLILLGLQVGARFPPLLTLILLVASALFAWHAYRSRLRYGWV